MSDKKTNNTPYQILPISPWPALTSLFVTVLFIGITLAMHKSSKLPLFIGLGGLIFCCFFWWRDVILESKSHTKEIKSGLKIGMIFFIVSEVALFISIFGSYFYSKLVLIGKMDDGIWPTGAVQDFIISSKIDIWDIPFINTLILLLSSCSLTWSHYSIIKENKIDFKRGLLCTILLGVIFIIFQAIEYSHAIFKLSENVHSANFYLITGFHGLHVLIGVCFLITCYFRANQISSHNHTGFNFAAMYWHFVDIIWIILFIFVYLLN